MHFSLSCNNKRPDINQFYNFQTTFYNYADSNTIYNAKKYTKMTIVTNTYFNNFYKMFDWIRFGRRLSYSMFILFGGVSCLLALAAPTTKGLTKYVLFHFRNSYNKCLQSKGRKIRHSED